MIPSLLVRLRQWVPGRKCMIPSFPVRLQRTVTGKKCMTPFLPVLMQQTVTGRKIMLPSYRFTRNGPPMPVGGHTIRQEIDDSIFTGSHALTGHWPSHAGWVTYKFYLPSAHSSDMTLSSLLGRLSIYGLDCQLGPCWLAPLHMN